jgi:hypothetical protein
MQWCLLCQREKSNREFSSDRASCRQCLGRVDRAWALPNQGEYGPYIDYPRKIAKKRWPRNEDEAESIAWDQIVTAKELYDPSKAKAKGRPLEFYTRLRIYNEIQNQRRKAEPLVPWTSLGKFTTNDDWKRREIRIEAGIAAQPWCKAVSPDCRAIIDDPTNAEMVDAERRVRVWLLWSQLFGEPLTFENAKAHFGVTDPTVASAKAFGYAMKALGYKARKRRIKGHESLVRVYEPPEPISIAS